MSRLSQLAAATGGTLHGRDGDYAGGAIDTRKLQAGELFFALPGEHTDGHRFLRRAASLGAAAAVVNEVQAGVSLPQIQVADVARALQQAGAAHRSGWHGQLFAVTGSNGKTTVKELLAGVLRHQAPCLATFGNLNNHLGVPLTLLRLTDEHRYAVLELGANHPGEIASLVELCRPQVGIVTQAADAHLEGFGSRDGVARAKGELFAALGEGHTAVINADDHYARLWTEMAAPAAIVRFGREQPADVRATGITPMTDAMSFDLHIDDVSGRVTLPLPGSHNVSNALAAAAAATVLGLPFKTIRQGLEQAVGVIGRLRMSRARNRARIIDDTYNANPASLRAALDVLAAQSGEHWLVMGDMGELGEGAVQAHASAGVEARESGVCRLLTVGELAAHASAAFGDGATHLSDMAALQKCLADELPGSATVLVKGSRSARMERVVKFLMDEA